MGDFQLKNMMRVAAVLLLAWAGQIQASGPRGGLIDDIDELPPIPAQPEPKQSKPSPMAPPPDLNTPAPPTKPPEAKPTAPKTSETPPPSSDRMRTQPERSQNSHHVPVLISSQGLRATRDGGVAELERDVVITQGDLRLESDQAKVYFHIGTNEVEKVHAKENVKVTKESDIQADRIVARGREAIFYNEQRKVVLKGNARLWRGGDLIKGTQITYDMETGWITVDRVEGVMQPGKGG